MEERKEEFRQYLEEYGVITAMTKALVKLYERKSELTGTAAVEFVQRNLDEHFPTVEQYQNLLKEVERKREILAQHQSQQSGTTSSSTNQTNPTVGNSNQPIPVTSGAVTLTTSNTTTTTILEFQSDGTKPVAFTNKRTLGQTEHETVADMCGAIKEIAEEENVSVRSHLQIKFTEFQALATCNSLLKQNLTLDLCNQFKDTEQKTLCDWIEFGTKHPDAPIGIFASHDDSYAELEAIFEPIIRAYHKRDIPVDHTTLGKWVGDAAKFVGLDQHNLITAIRIQCVRSFNKFNFTPSMAKDSAKDEFTELLEEVKVVTTANAVEFDGELIELEDLPDDKKNEMFDKKILKEAQGVMSGETLFHTTDESLKDAGALNSWPTGRAVFKSNDDKFLLYINGEDHLQFLSMSDNGNMKDTYIGLRDRVKKFDGIDFKKNDRLGYLNFSPKNLGSAIRVSVRIKVPNLTDDKLEELANSHWLEYRRTTDDDGTGGQVATVAFANKQSLGLTEYETVKAMFDAIKEIIQEEEVAAAATAGP